MRIVSRSEWGARPPKSRAAMTAGLDRVFVHWLGSRQSTSDEIERLRRAQTFHMAAKPAGRGWSDIAYSFAVGQSGIVYEGRGLRVAGGHTYGENRDSYGVVALIGEGEQPTPAMLRGFKQTFEHIRLHHRADGMALDPSQIVVMGHRRDDQANTACPGPELDEWSWGYNHARDYDVDVDDVEESSMAKTINVPDPHVEAMQAVCEGAGIDVGVRDGIPGPKLLAGVEALAAKAAQAGTVVDRKTEEDAGKYRALVNALKALGVDL